MSGHSGEAWVVDASVAVKWFLPADHEPEADLARGIMGSLPLCTTTLAYYEAGNALTKRGRMKPQQVRECLETIASTCGPPVDMTAVDYEEAATLAGQYKITFYDASYVAIANRLNRTVVSADRDLLDPGLAVDLAGIAAP